MRGIDVRWEWAGCRGRERDYNIESSPAALRCIHEYTRWREGLRLYIRSFALLNIVRALFSLLRKPMYMYRCVYIFTFRLAATFPKIRSRHPAPSPHAVGIGRRRRLTRREPRAGYAAKGLLYANLANDCAFRVEPDWGIKLLPRCHHNPPYCAGSLLRDLPVLIFILVLPRSTICSFSPLTHPRKTPPRPSGSVLFRTVFFVLSIRGVVANKHAWCLK